MRMSAESAKIKSVKKNKDEKPNNGVFMVKKKMWGLLRMYATPSENRAKERVCKAKRGKLARRVMEEAHGKTLNLFLCLCAMVAKIKKLL